MTRPKAPTRLPGDLDGDVQDLEGTTVDDLSMIQDPNGGAVGFEVTVRAVVGRVIFGDGRRSPWQAAFDLIGEHGAPGVFEFPHEDGGVVVVDVKVEGR